MTSINPRATIRLLSFEEVFGYTVTREDLDPSRRPAEYRRLRASTSRRSLSGHPLTLCAFLETLGLNRDTHDRFRSRADLVATHRDVLAQLHLLVTVNGLRFAADPNLNNALMTYGPVGAGDLPLALYDLMSYTLAC